MTFSDLDCHAVCHAVCHQYLSFLFLSRDAMRKRGLCRCPVSVRLSVRLSDTMVHCIFCIHTAEDIVKLLSRPGSPTNLVVDPSAGTKFQREFLQRGRKIHGGGKILDFRLKSPSISETVRDRPMVAMERYYRKSYAL